MEQSSLPPSDASAHPSLKRPLLPGGIAGSSKNRFFLPSSSGLDFFQRSTGGVCDDLLCLIASYLSVPDIPVFALISKEFNRIVVEGVCFQDLALKLFPRIDDLYAILPDLPRLTYTEKLRRERTVMRPSEQKRDWSDSHLTGKELLEKNDRMKRELANRFSYILRFDNTVKTFTWNPFSDSPRSVQLDVIVEKGGWTTRHRLGMGPQMTLSFPLAGVRAVEIPIWQPMEDFGLPSEDLYEKEKERRQNYYAAEYYHDHALEVEFSIFAVDRNTGKVGKVLSSGESGERVDDGEDPEDVLCLMYETSDCRFSPNHLTHPYSKSRFYKTEGVGGVPMLMGRVEEIFVEFLSWDDSDNSSTPPEKLQWIHNFRADRGDPLQSVMAMFVGTHIFADFDCSK